MGVEKVNWDDRKKNKTILEALDKKKKTDGSDHGEEDEELEPLSEEDGREASMRETIDQVVGGTGRSFLELKLRTERNGEDRSLDW